MFRPPPHASRVPVPKATWTPARLMLLAYVAAILIGAAVLMLPVCAEQKPIGLLDSLFTATSAVCVTGLVVLDTPAAFTRTGHWVILALIQLGGLGILGFATWILMLGGRRPGGLQQGAAGISYGSARGVPIGRILVYVFLVTLVFETLGWMAFYHAWRGEMGRPEAAFQALFHTVSAFCNAGFTTLPGGSMVPYAAHWGVGLTTAVLVIAGGLGFIILAELGTVLSRRRRPSLHTRIALWMTLILLAGGTAALLLLEWNGALGQLPWHGRPLAAFFQSMTARTAGFNTVEIGALTAPSLIIIILLMIVGASPGSTGGGIKVTTLAILLALVRSQAYERRGVDWGGRSIRGNDVARALAIASLYMLTLFVGLTLLLLIQGPGLTPHGQQAMFLPLLFEAASALGTVGLSLDWTTGQLHAGSKVVVMGLMLCGRLGPIVIFLSFIGRPAPRRFEYPEEPVMTG